MILAELEVFHSRPIAPTRRVAVGRADLPIGDLPGFGGLLLGGLIARYGTELEPDMLTELHRLTYEVERGQRIPQPRLRHRLQADRVGLLCSTHRLVRDDAGRVSFEFETRHHAPAQYVLAAVYAARIVPYEKRLDLMPILRRAIGWGGGAEDDAQLVAYLSAGNAAFALSMASHNDPVSWAMETLGFQPHDTAEPSDVQKSFRRLLRTAHPDTAAETNGSADDAAKRIAELTEARRILLP